MAREILARPEFAGPAPSFVERARDWVLERLAELLGGVVSGGRFSPAGWVVVGLAVAGAALGLRRALTGLSADPTAAVEPAASVKDAGSWRAEAERHERAGAWREALRCRYRALVADLAARGVFDDRPGWTTGEEREALARSAPQAAASFGVIADLFDRAWYGMEPVGADELRRVRDLEAAVLAGAGR